MNTMMIQLNDLEQHNRRDYLRIECIQEDIDDSTNTSVIRIAKDYLGVEVKQSDIESSYRLGKQNEDPKKFPWPVMVKFTSCSVCRNVYQKRTKLKTVVNEKIYINENLTKSRYELAKQVRSSAKDKKYKSTWTADGKVFFLKSENEKPKLITNIQDLESLG